MMKDLKARHRDRLLLRVPVMALVLALMAMAVAIVPLAVGTGHQRSRSGMSQQATSAIIASAQAGPGAAVATIGAHEHVFTIPRSFLGFSTEYWTLPVDEHHTSLYTKVLALVQVPGDGRFVLRIGGDSSDHAIWDPESRRLAPWAFDVTPALVARTAKIIGQMHLRVIVDLNTITSTSRIGGEWARGAMALLPRGSIQGFEIGNEPDLYDRGTWVAALRNTTFDVARLPVTITGASYARDYDAFATAIHKAEPGVRLLTPALANPVRHLNWISILLHERNPGPEVITVHRYPYSACARPGRPQFPTVQKLLSEQATAGMAATVKPAVALARRYGILVRVSELNSVTCGGVQGVSNAFATALWAPDALFELIHAGVKGVDLHVRVFSINAPFRFDQRGVRARPLLYGLILFKRMLGPNSRLVPVHLRSRRSLHLKVWAVRVGSNTLNVLLINKGSRSITVNLGLPASVPATVQRLLAPSAASQSGVTLGGQKLSEQVAWTGQARQQTITPTAGRYTVAVRRLSASLLTVRVAASTLAGR